jgi:hypothetical protein
VSKILIPCCPVCKKNNVTPAHITGHANKGTKKTMSKAALDQRKTALKAARKAKRSR